MAQNEIGETYQQEQLSRRRPKWTIMIYLAGDNNLSANSIAIMQELEAANHREDVRVLACFDSNTPRPRGARYLEINHRRNTANIEMDWGLHNDLVPPEERGDHTVVAPDFCNEDISSIHLPDEPVAREGLSRFLTFALKYHRADRHMLILFGHGTAVAGQTFLADSNPPSFLRLDDFAEVLRRHFGESRSKLDILACHNCVMNGIESAYQIRREVDFMLGSQGLVLAAGWPYRKIINAIERNPSAPSKRIALRVLKACARGLLDFSLMDRSSEQSLCNLRRFDHDDSSSIVKALDDLSEILIEGLQTNAKGELVYPIISDAVRLARLDAQAYWDETFVDLYDFCELLLNKCNDFMKQEVPLFRNLFIALFTNLKSEAPESREDSSGRSLDPDDVPREIDIKNTLLGMQPMALLQEIGLRCIAVLKKIKDFNEVNTENDFVPYSYYVGPELQYSHGLSIYFPWTLPEDPIIFDPSYPDSNDFLLKTAFDEYKTYDFARNTKWVAFLDRFFRATLRGVRRFDQRYKDSSDDARLLFDAETITERVAPPVSIHKSGSDVDREEAFTCPKIKNYPRRFYLSPADCLCRCDGSLRYCPPSQDGRKYCASYLGWNIRGLVANVIGLPQFDGSSEPSDSAESES